MELALVLANIVIFGTAAALISPRKNLIPLMGFVMGATLSFVGVILVALMPDAEATTSASAR